MKKTVFLIVVFITFLLLFVSCGGKRSGSSGVPKEVPIEASAVPTEAMTPTATSPVRATPNFVQMEDASVSRALMESPELFLVSVSSIADHGGFVNQGPSNPDGYVFQFPGAIALRNKLMQNGKLDTSLRATGEVCAYDMADYVNAVRSAAREYQIPMEIMGPLILSESSFVNTFPDGNGGCYLINNQVAACLGQIYKPSGWKFAGSEIHPETNVWDLFNPYTCMQHSARILDGRQYWTPLTGARGEPESWFNLVAGYKNISTSHEHFTGVFLKYYQAGGFSYTHSDGKTYWVDFSSAHVDEVFSFE